MADKRRQQQWQGPQNYSAHGLCIYCVILPASDKGGGGENGGQAAAFMYLYVDVSHQEEGGSGCGREPDAAASPSISTFQYGRLTR